MAKPWKHPRTGVYWFRRGVPRDCREIVGKTMWQQTLGTKSLREAERAILPLLAETNQIIDDIHAGTFRRYTDDQLEQIAMAWCSDFGITLMAAQELRREGFQGEPISDEDREFPIRDEPDLDQSLQSFLDRMDWTDLGPKVEPGWSDYRLLRELAHLEHYHSQVASRPPVLERLEGQPVRMKPGEGPGLLEVFQRYLREKQPREKTVLEFTKAIQNFCDLHGGDVPIRDVTKAQIVEYKDLLMQKPRRLTKVQRKMNLRELIASLDGESETIDPKTVEQQLIPLGAVFTWAVANDLVESNPVTGVKRAKRTNGKRRRLPYGVDHLNQIFASPVWSGCKSRGRRSEPGEVVIRDAKFWLPLLALFSGARLEELAQLATADVREQEGIHFLKLQEIEEGQSLKTPGSARRVPIHPELVRLGFLQYVEKQRKAKAKMLFPELKPYRGRYSFAFSKWYGTYCRNTVGISDPRFTFHSFRHSFKDAGREAAIDKSLVDAIQGHSDNSVSGSYGSGYSLKALDRAMKRIRYPGLKLN